MTRTTEATRNRRRLAGSGWLFACIVILAAAGACAASWEMLGPFGASVETLALAPTDPDIVYVAANSIGLFRSTDGGSTWARTGLVTQDIIAAVLVDPRDARTLYAGTSSGFYVSDDAGETWTKRNRGLTSSYLMSLAADPTDANTLYAGAWGGLFKSTNAGEDWVNIGSALGEVTVQALAVHPTNRHTVFAGTADRGVFRSSDGGQSWTNRSAGLGDLFIRDLVIDPSNPQTLYVATNQAGVYRTHDGGLTWVSANEGVTGGSFRLAVDPRSPGALFLGTQGGGVWRSADRGTSWERWTTGLPANASVYGLAVRPDNGAVVAGLFSHGVYRRAPGDAAWTDANRGMTGYIVSSLVIDAASGTWLAGIETYGPSVFRSEDAGATWTASGSGMFYPPVYAMVQDPVDPLRFTTGNAGSSFRSTDGGATWSAADEGLDRGRITVYALLSGRVQPSRLLAGASSGVWMTSEADDVWQIAQATTGAVRALAQSPSAPGFLVAGGDRGNVYVSTDAGRHWTLSNEGLPAHVTVRALCFDPLAAETIYAGTEGAGIFRSDDAGRTWTGFLPSSETARTYALLALKGSGDLVAGTDQGVFVWERGQPAWRRVESALPDGTCIQLLVYDEVDNVLWAGGVNGLFRMDWGT